MTDCLPGAVPMPAEESGERRLARSLIIAWSRRDEAAAVLERAKIAGSVADRELQDSLNEAVSNGLSGFFRHDGVLYEIAKGPNQTRTVRVVRVESL